MRLAQIVLIAAYLGVTVWSLVATSPGIGNGVLIIWLLSGVGVGFVLQRWWALLLAFAPSPLSSLYQRTLGGGSGDGSMEAWRYVAGHLIFAAIGMVGIAIGWGIWRVVEFMWLDRSERTENLDAESHAGE